MLNVLTKEEVLPFREERKKYVYDIPKGFKEDAHQT